MGLKEWLEKRKGKAEQVKYTDIHEAPTENPEPESSTPELEENDIDVEEVAQSGGEITDTKEMKNAKELLDVLLKIETGHGKLADMVRNQFKMGLEFPAEVYVGVQKALEEVATLHTRQKHKIDYPSFTFGVGFCLREIMAEVLQARKLTEKKDNTNYIS